MPQETFVPGQARSVGGRVKRSMRCLSKKLRLRTQIHHNAESYCRATQTIMQLTTADDMLKHRKNMHTRREQAAASYRAARFDVMG